MWNTHINALSTRTFEDSLKGTTWWGQVVENTVGAHLRNNLNSVEYDITYWRRGIHEVDYVVSRGRDIWGIEVKSGRSGKLSGLAKFKETYLDAKVLIVGTHGIGLEEFFLKTPTMWMV